MKNKTRQAVPFLLLGGLLFLRFILRTGGAFFGPSGWINPAFEIGTYLLTALLIWWERKRLADFHVDLLALLLIIFFKPLGTVILFFWRLDSPLALPNWPAFLIWAIAIGLLVSLLVNRPLVTPVSWSSLKWIGIGLLAGLGTVLLISFPMSLQIDSTMLANMPGGRALLMQVFVGFFYQIGYVAVSEEPFFRGFLWGYLKELRWKDWWIWLFQAGLFMLAHLYYINPYPVSFWVIVPVCSLVLGWLAWRSRTIASSIVAHATMNALGFTVGYLIAAFLH
jgi:membrane protease YdiL (CAAX protease family)